MKKILFFVAIFTIALESKAQLVEVYPVSQRFLYKPFSSYIEYSHFNDGIIEQPSNPYSIRDCVYIHHCNQSERETNTIYGVALPMDYPNHSEQSDEYKYFWRVLMHHFDTSKSLVYLAVRAYDNDSVLTIIDSARFRVSETTITGNYFKMPDEDSNVYNEYNSPDVYAPVIEVYFNNPHTIVGDFYVGSNLAWLIRPGIFMFFNLVCRKVNGVIDQNPSSLYKDTGNDILLKHHVSSQYAVQHLTNQDMWSGPFPIIAPPPCMPPLNLAVTAQHKQGASLSWKVQYSTVYCELEYGPQGFAEGTGTTVGPFYPNANYICNANIDSLMMDSDYTVRVRAYCNISDTFSDWAEIDLHTNTFYTVSTSVNNSNWGYVVGGGDYIADTTIRLFAYPKSEFCPFVNWNDGSNQNPRIVTVTKDTSFRANFQCDSVGIHNIYDSILTLNINPNPAHNLVNVSASTVIDSWTLYDIQGRKLLAAEPKQAHFDIYLKGLEPGIYIITALTATGKKTIKIVKQ